ncbi:MAG: DUF4139 domain-containing protein [Deltaproteobacteria bacterium]|nr:DUF4139 domain-containing protein [Deltaproteobacteria bacterium]
MGLPDTRGPMDPAVSVDRTLASRAQARRGERDEQALHYDFRVSNHRQEAVDLVVFERLPVSHSQGLLVQRTTESRAPLAHQEGDAPGVVRWNVRLAPGASDRGHLGVRVSMPHGRALESELES